MRSAISLLLLPLASSLSLTVSVSDAATGNPLSSGLLCSLYDESNALVSTSSSCSLAASCSLADQLLCPKVFRLIVTKAGSSPGYYPLTKSGLQLHGGSNSLSVQMSTKLLLTAATKQLRVVLSWGRAHADLDAYMLVPPASGTGATCTTNYGNKNGCASARLDVDDRSYYGPETTTLTNPHDGVYSYLVHIYGKGSKCWDTSGIQARVEVWGSKAGGLVKALAQPLENPPPRCANTPATRTCHAYWHVFDLDSTTNRFEWVNKMVPSLGAASAARSAGKSMASYLPSLAASSCACQRATAAAASSALSWASFATTAAASLAATLLSDAGVAGQATCHAQLQQFYSAAGTEGGAVKAWGAAATAAVNSLAAKVSARFEARKAIAMSMRNRAAAIYAGTHPGAPASTVGPMCANACAGCTFDAGFMTSVNRNSFGLRFGAKAAAAGSPVRIADEAVARGLGDMVTGAGGTFAEHPSTKWAYLGSEGGVNVIAPQWVGSRADCRAYDPRLRPWYAEATSRAKNVVVVIDGSQPVSAEQLLSLKAAAKAVLGTLAAGDTANVVVGRGAGVTETPGDYAASDLTYRACQGSQMLRMVPVNKKLLLRFLDAVAAGWAATAGDMDAAAAMRKAQTLLAAQRTFAAASYPAVASSDVVVVLRATAGTTSSTWPTASAATASMAGVKAELSPPAHWAHFYLSAATVPNFPALGAADEDARFAPAEAGFAPARYYAHAALNKNPAPGTSASAAFASAFYEDSSGLGLVTTIVAPVYDAASAALRGVVGLDVTVQELVADVVFDREFTSSYAFLVDAAGSAIWHPALPNPTDGVAEAVNIVDLEVSPAFASQVYAELVAGTQNQKTISVAAPVARGDATYSGFATVTRSVTFAYRAIAGTPFRLCVVMAQPDANPAPLTSAQPAACSSSGLASEPVVACDVYHDLALGHTCGKPTRANRGADGKLKATIDGAAAVFYSASAFDGPAAWLTHPETRADAKAIADAHTCVATDAPPFISKSVRRLKAAAVNDNMVTRQIDGCWRAAQASSGSSSSSAEVVWTYFGSANGLWRNMPATLVRKKYEAAKRPWYLAAVANVDGLSGAYGATVSTPYLDASGAGEVVTISRAVTRGGTGAGSPVAGVVGADFKLSELQRLVGLQAPCGEASVQCMLLDETAHLIFHDDFVATAAAEENVFLAAKHREVAARLVAAGALAQNTCMDYASGERKTSYRVDLAGAAARQGALASCGGGFWALARVGKSNTYLLALTNNGCISNAAQRQLTCAPCNEANCKSAVWAGLASRLLCQPCRCKVDYNSCDLNYPQAAPKHAACPASPPPLFSDLCPGPAFWGDTDEVVLGTVTAPAFFAVFVGLAFGLCTMCYFAAKRHPATRALLGCGPSGGAKAPPLPSTAVAAPQQVVIQYGQPQNPAMPVAQHAVVIATSAPPSYTA